MRMLSDRVSLVPLPSRLPGKRGTGSISAVAVPGTRCQPSGALHEYELPAQEWIVEPMENDTQHALARGRAPRGVPATTLAPVLSSTPPARHPLCHYECDTHLQGD